MRVKFLQDFRGRETHEVYYLAGDIADIENADLVKRGICEPVIEKSEVRATVSPTKKDENEKNLDQVHNSSRRKRNG